MNRERKILATHSDTHRENTPSNKTEVLTKSIDMYIWATGILNQLFIRCFYTQAKFSKKWTSQWQKSIFCDRFSFYFPFQSVLPLAFDRTVLYENVTLSFAVRWTKKWYSGFLRKVLVFQKTNFKIKVLKTFKTAWFSHKNMLIS